MFIGRNGLVGTTVTPSNAKTVAHELAHVVFSSDPVSTALMGGGDDNADLPGSVNILSGGPQDNLNLLKKRFNEKQIDSTLQKSRFTRKR